jgi:hemolysin activation/secretion protein
MKVRSIASWDRYVSHPTASWALIVSLLLCTAGAAIAQEDKAADAEEVEAKIAETEQATASAIEQLQAAKQRLREVENQRADTLRKIEEEQKRLQDAIREAEMARNKLKTANTVLQNIEDERSHAARQLVDASVSTTAQPGDSDGKTYTITGLILEYAQDHPAHIAPEELMELKVELLRTLSGFVSPRADDVNSRVSLMDIPELSENRYYGSAVRKICVALVAHFNSQGLIGVYVSPDPGQIDLRSGQDFRTEGQTTLKIVIRTAIITTIGTVARGGRFDPSVRMNNPAHARIRNNAPLQPAIPGDFGSGALLHKDQLDRYLNWLNRHPGRRVDVALSSAGEDTPGGVALDLLVSENKPWLAYFQISNTGTDSTDIWRERFGFVHNQLTGNDDIFSIDYTTAAFDQVHTVVASYERPWGDNDRVRWRVFGYYSEFDASNVGLADENFEGQEWSIGAEVTCNIYQQGHLFVDAVAGIAWRDIRNENTLIDEENSTTFLTPYVGVNMEKIERTSSLFASVQFKFNLPDIADTDADGVSPLGSTGTVGANDNYYILSWNSSYSFFLEPMLNPEGWNDSSTPASSTLAHEIYLSFRGQYAFEQRIVSQEQFVIGGLYSVRGYEQSESAGHSGMVATFEYRYHVPRAFALREQPGTLLGHPFKWAPQQAYGMPDWDLILRAFVDVGYAMLHDSFRFEDDEGLVGTGIGAELAVKRNVTVRVDWGFALSETETTDFGHNEVHVVATLLY